MERWTDPEDAWLLDGRSVLQPDPTMSAMASQVKVIKALGMLVARASGALVSRLKPHRPAEAQPVLLPSDIRAGLANGSMRRGPTHQTAAGTSMQPVLREILVPARVAAVTDPAEHPGTVIAWQVVERPVVSAAGWSAVVVAILATAGDGSDIVTP